jgi:hypothetical protein
MYYIQIEYLEEKDGSLQHAGASSGYTIQLGHECHGVYYLGTSESGVYSGLTTSNPAEVVFEMLFSLSLIREYGAISLCGRVYTMNLDSGGTIVSGKRTPIASKIQFDSPVVVETGTFADGRKAAMNILVSDKKPVPERPEIASGIELITTLLVDGKGYTTSTNSCSILKDTFVVNTAFGRTSSNGDPQYSTYEVRIQLGPTNTGGGALTSRRLVLDRRYVIDTSSFYGQEFDSDLVYTSQYIKDIEYRKGRVVRLVFPPDSPSVLGFDIEDTLTIVPE